MTVPESTPGWPWAKSHAIALIVATLSFLTAALVVAAILLYLAFCQRVEAQSALITERLDALPSFDEVELMIDDSTARLEWRMEETKSSISSSRDDAKKELDDAREELDHHFRLAQKDSRRTLCVVCRRSRDLHGDSLCIENGCYLQGQITFQGRELSFPVLPSTEPSKKASDFEERAPSATSSAQGTTSLVLFMRDGDRLELISSEELKVAAAPESKDLGGFTSFIIDKRFIPLPEGSQDSGWDDIVEAIKYTQEIGGEVTIKALSKPGEDAAE